VVPLFTQGMPVAKIAEVTFTRAGAGRTSGRVDRVPRALRVAAVTV
jgi:hypothetical protein